MRVAVITNQFPGPVSTFFARDVRGLLEAGVDVDVLPLYPLDPKLWECVPNILNDRVFPRQRVHHLSLGAALASALNPRPFSRSSSVLRVAASVTVDACSYGVMPVAKSLYSLTKASAWAGTFRSTWDHVLAYWGNYSATSAYAYHRITGGQVPFSMLLHAGTDLYREPVLLRAKMLASKNILVVCDFNRRYIKQHFADIYPVLEPKIRLHHLGLDLQELKYCHQRSRDARIVAAGRMEKGKGFDYLLRAVHMLRQRDIDIRVDLVGDGSQAASLKTLASDLGLTGHTRFLGWLRPDDVPEAIRRADIFVHACHWERGGDLDAVPTVIKEALAVGTPVVASAVAGIPELLDDGRCGILVPPSDVEALARAIETLLKDESRRSSLAQAGRRHAERHFDLWRNSRALAQLCSRRTDHNNPHLVNPLLLKAYHRLPPAGRSLAVSIHGRRLNAWRYGPETERLVEEALD